MPLNQIIYHSNTLKHLRTSKWQTCVCVCPKSNISFRVLCFFLRKSNLLQQSVPTTTGVLRPTEFLSWFHSQMQQSGTRWNLKAGSPENHLAVCRGRSSSNQAFMTLGFMLNTFFIEDEVRNPFPKTWMFQVRKKDEI